MQKLGGAGDGGLRQGDRRRRDLREDQRDQVSRPVRMSAASPLAALPLARTSRRNNNLASRCANTSTGSTACCRWLLTFLIAILIVPVTMQIVSRYTDFIPNYIWTEEMARFCLIWMIMLGATIGGARWHAFRRRRAAASEDRRRRGDEPDGGASSSIFLVALIFLAFGWRFAQFG